MSRKARWNQRYAAANRLWSAEPNPRFAEEVAALPPGRALDAGCGEGRHAIWLAERGWQVAAVDFSDVAIARSAAEAARRGLAIDWRVLDLAADPLPTGPFDLVFALYLHTDPEERAIWLPALIRRVAPGGTFLYIGHDPDNVAHGVGGPQLPELLPSAAEIEHALAGFEIQAAGTITRSVDAEPGHGRELSGMALDTLVRARRLSADPAPATG